MTYSVHILPSAEKDYLSLPKQIALRCQKAVLKLESNPRPQGSQKLVGEDGYRVRVGDYRILYRIDDPQKRIYIYRIKHRREVYR
ncbi:MAG: type II toxin-antitoxin system RelE/ParE family toxin [Deltaproteobacteria bacterium]|nr:type II toxin-antitoxin system RelE/ParE family toxin [Deltaproteobacteria bacterium]